MYFGGIAEHHLKLILNQSEHHLLLIQRLRTVDKYRKLNLIPLASSKRNRLRHNEHCSEVSAVEKSMINERPTSIIVHAQMDDTC